MRAAVLRGGRLEVRETADPEPGPGELLLRTPSTAICASDEPEAIDMARRSEGPPRIIVHPNGDIT